MWLLNLILDSSRNINGEQIDPKYQNLCRKGEKAAGENKEMGIRLVFLDRMMTAGRAEVN